MKRLVCVFIFCLTTLNFLFSQENVLTGMQGLSYASGLIFENEGYVVTIEKTNTSLDQKGIRKIKKKYGLKGNVREYTDHTIRWEHRVLDNENRINKQPEVINYKLCYIFPETDEESTVVVLHSVNQKNRTFEESFMKAFFSRKLSEYVSDDWVADTVHFVGRNIILGNACRWISPHNIHCPAFGQISWSTFATEKAAKQNYKTNIVKNEFVDKKYKMEKQDTIDVYFEGIPTQAVRVFYKVNKSVFLSGGRNLLAVYYVFQKVRGRYVSCILSHYVEDSANYFLAPLLGEVMELR